MRMTNARREALHAPLVRAVIAAAIVGGAGVVVDADRGVVLLIALATGITTREISAAGHAARRHALSIEAHQALLAFDHGPTPPPLRGWAIAPDFGLILLEQLRRRPQVVVECGSGTSTLLIASALSANGIGRLYSLEHDAAFADRVRRLLAERGLAELVEVIHAPLAPQTFEQTAIDWYDANCIPDPTGPIDLLVIDGPPPAEAFSRWPAVEVFHPKLSPHSCVLLDDGRRRGERRVALRWAKSYPDLALHWIDTEKGTWMLSRHPYPLHGSGLRSAARRMRRALHPRPPGFGHTPISR